MTQRQRIRKALKDGPATSGELAMELGLPVRIVSAQLNSMAHQGVVQRIGRSALPLTRWANVYALPNPKPLAA